MKDLVLTIFTSISTFVIGGFITYIYEEIKHKKSDYRLKYIISKIDTIQEWGEYIESTFHKDTLTLDANMERKIKALFNDARKNCIRMDRRYDRRFRESIDVINPLVAESFKKKTATDIIQLKKNILDMIASFLDDLEKLRFELYSHPFPKGVKSTKKKFIKNLVIALLVVFIIFTRSCSQRDNYHWMEKNRIMAYEEIGCCIQTYGQQLGSNQAISSLFEKILMEEPYFFTAIFNFRTKCMSSIVSRNDIMSFQEDLRQKNKIFLLDGFISKLKIIKSKFGKIKPEGGKVRVNDSKVKMEQIINDALIDLEEIKGKQNLNECYSKFSKDIKNFFSKLLTSIKYLKSTFGSNIDEYCIHSMKILSNMEKRASAIETNRDIIILKILVEMSDKKFISILKDATMSKSLHKSLRVSIIDKIGEMGNMEDLEFLIRLLKDKSDSIKNASIFAIATILSRRDNYGWNEFLNGN